MPFDAPASAWRDILDSIELIEQVTAGMATDDFRSDPKTVAAVERKLQVVSEAAIRPGDEAEVMCPGLPWRNIRGIGNWLRHQYERVDLDTIWRTVEADLPPLKAAIVRALTPAG